MSGVSIRPAEPSDLAEVVRMIRELHIHVGSDVPPKVSVETLLSDGPSGHGNFAILVAEEAGVLVGLCLYTFAFSGWRGRSGVFIEDLYVDQKMRGSGIGRRLLMASLDKEAHRGAAFIKLEVNTANFGAVDFYRKCGFEIDENEAIMAFG